MATRMRQRRGTAAEWAAENPILADGELGYERDTKIVKMGDGLTAWADLPGIVVARAFDADKLAGVDATEYLLQDRSVNPVPLRLVRSGKDTNSIFTIVEEYRVGGNRIWRSELSGGTSPQYTTRTVTEYALNGTTVVRTTVYTLAYDANGDLTSETVA